jgi:predicted nucleotidyltransferase
MTNQRTSQDWSVTPEKIEEAIRRIVDYADPLQIILFGSRARGTSRPDSDLDIAVILDSPEENVRKLLPHSVLRGLRMEVSLIVVSKTKFDLHKPWLNSVFNYIDREGIILYDRQNSESSRTNALQAGGGRRIGPSVSTA